MTDDAQGRHGEPAAPTHRAASGGPHPPISAGALTPDRVQALLNAIVMIGTGLDLETLLRRIAEAAADLVGAQYGALGVLGPDGRLERFVATGLDPADGSPAHWPEGHGILGLIVKDPRPLRLGDFTEHPESRGLPPGHPPMSGFLGVPIRVRDAVFGNLYLTEKTDGSPFDAADESIVVALATAAGVAVENARLYDETRRRETWLDASDEISTRLLTGADTDEVLDLVARRSRRMSEADLVAIAVPTTGPPTADSLFVRFADGPKAQGVLGRAHTLDGSLAGRVHRGGEPVNTHLERPGADSAPLLSGLGLGPVLMVPLGARDNTRGVLLLGRDAGSAPFPPAAARMLHAFAGHAAIALELADARNGAERLSVLEDRDRIAKDLHDVVIQRMFAIAMSLMSSVRRINDPPTARRVQQAVDDLDDTIRQTRSTIFALQHVARDDLPSLRDRILDIVNTATDHLGHTPGLRLDGPIDSAVSNDVAEHALAVLREALSNTARHAGASRTDVSIDATGGRLAIDLRDDGVGLPREGHRSGLRNLAQRARSLDGEFAASTRPDGGTHLRWDVPLDSGDRDEEPEC